MGKSARFSVCGFESNQNSIFYTMWYHCDALGSPRKMTDESGAVTWTGAYQPFGEMITGSGNVHGFTPLESIRLLTGQAGKELDAETGLNYFCLRYYDPQIGRFMTLDPFGGYIELPQMRYGYCINNPLKYIDPLGLDEEEFITMNLGNPGFENARYPFAEYYPEQVGITKGSPPPSGSGTAPADVTYTFPEYKFQPYTPAVEPSEITLANYSTSELKLTLNIFTFPFAHVEVRGNVYTDIYYTFLVVFIPESAGYPTEYHIFQVWPPGAPAVIKVRSQNKRK